MWILVIIASCLLLIWLWWRWASRPYTSTLGQTDYSTTIRHFARCVRDGGTLTLKAVNSDVGVSLIRHSAEGGDVELEFKLLGSNVTMDRIEAFRRNLELLRIPFRVENSAEVAADGRDVSFWLGEAAIERGGRIIDLALSSGGLTAGAKYAHRFEGEFDPQADSEYLRDLTVAARDLSETRLQERLFDRILKHLR